MKPAVSIEDASGAEGSSGTTNLSFTVSLSKATVLPVSVSYTTADGTATASSDYQSASGKLAFASGETSKTITVVVVGDTTYEPNETFTVTISNPVNASIGNGSATGTITNDDTLAMPGDWKGTTSQNELFAFTVTPDEADVTGIKTAGRRVVRPDLDRPGGRRPRPRLVANLPDRTRRHAQHQPRPVGIDCRSSADRQHHYHGPVLGAFGVGHLPRGRQVHLRGNQLHLHVEPSDLERLARLNAR